MPKTEKAEVIDLKIRWTEQPWDKSEGLWKVTRESESTYAYVSRKGKITKFGTNKARATKYLNVALGLVPMNPHNHPNPWAQRHIKLEYAFCGEGYTPQLAREIVAQEYHGHDKPEKCPCCGKNTHWWKGTVGTNVCTSCGQVGDKVPESEACRAETCGAFKIRIGGKENMGNYEHGLHLEYSACNMAWFVMWHAAIIAVCYKRREAEHLMAELAYALCEAQKPRPQLQTSK